MERPKIAIIDANTLAVLGLKQLLQTAMPVMTVDTFGSMTELTANNPEQIITACPLCLKTFGRFSPVPVKDFAEVLAEHLERLGKRLGEVPALEILVRDEYRTTEMAKGEYWKANPPKGWRRLLPVTMQVPPVPVDDFVAVILGRRYLKESSEHGAE